MSEQAIRELQLGQAGVICRRQVLELGGDDNLVDRRLRCRQWARVHPGVYVDHTGPPTWEQRAWAAVLSVWPAALDGSSALRAWSREAGSLSRRDTAPIDVVVDHSRRVTAPDGVRVRRLRAFEGRAAMHLSPPRLRYEDAVLRLASARAGEDAAVATLADACQSRRTTAARLRDCLASLPRTRRRRLLAEVLEDVASGAFSALERRFLRDVERRHGLPRGRRQLREAMAGGVVFRDVLYPDQAVLVELDGRLGHEWAADRWSDLDRDVASAEEQRLTLRVSWKQVLDPCRLAGAVARILHVRGWEGPPRACSPGCPLAVWGGSSAPRADDPPHTAA